MSEIKGPQFGPASAESQIINASNLPLYRHQVSGHFPMLYEGNNIWKPAAPVEVEFYTTLLPKQHPSLAPFVPSFQGVRKLVNAAPANAKGSKTKGNDWGLKCHEKKKDKLAEGVLQYILLENVTNVFARPSILDLKLGTQQHSADDPPEKIKSKQMKVLNTTSHTLGVRFCGSQVYHPGQDTWVFRDKYFGRKLDVTGFTRSLREYFWNGFTLRLDAIQAFLDKLIAFRDVVALPSRLQFRSSSLLFVYEGKLPESTSPTAASTNNPSTPPANAAPAPLADMRFIDFAHTEVSDKATVDDGLLLGLDSLIVALRSILDDYNQQHALPGFSMQALLGPVPASTATEAVRLAPNSPVAVHTGVERVPSLTQPVVASSHTAAAMDVAVMTGHSFAPTPAPAAAQSV